MPSQVDEWCRNKEALKHGELLPDFDPSPEQTAALSARILKGRSGASCRLFATHTAWQTSCAKGSAVDLGKCGSRVLGFLPALRVDHEDPGSCVATPSSLEAHIINSQAVVREVPEACHLCASADRCRAEHFPRLARLLSAKKGQSPQPLVRGVRRCARARAVLVSRNPPPSCGGHSKAPVQRVGNNQAQDHQARAGTVRPKALKKEEKGLFVTSAEGRSGYFSRSKRLKEEGCRIPCPEGPAPVCMLCLQPHRNRACLGNT